VWRSDASLKALDPNGSVYASGLASLETACCYALLLASMATTTCPAARTCALLLAAEKSL
jgi:hypothetical protein